MATNRLILLLIAFWLDRVELGYAYDGNIASAGNSPYNRNKAEVPWSLPWDYRCSPKSPKKARIATTITMIIIAPSNPILAVLLLLNEKVISIDTRSETISIWRLQDEEWWHANGFSDGWVLEKVTFLRSSLHFLLRPLHHFLILEEERSKGHEHYRKRYENHRHHSPSIGSIDL